MNVIEGAYFVSGENEERNHLAIRPAIDSSRDKIEWWDTSRGEGLFFKTISYEEGSLSKLPKNIYIVTKDDENITLQLISLELFNKKLRDKVAISPKTTFKNDEEVQQAFLNVQEYSKEVS